MIRVPSDLKENQFESLKIKDHTFVAYRSDVYPQKYDVYFEDHALIYVLEGDKSFNGPNQSIKVSKGDVLFVQRGYYFMTESINESYKSLVFFFEEKLLKLFVEQNKELFLNTADPNNSSLFFKLNSDEALSKYMESLLPYFKSKTSFLEQFLRLKLQELLLHILELDKTQQFKQLLFSISKGKKTELEFLMKAYFLKPLSIEELAQLSGRSTSVFKKEFKEIFKTSPAVWIKNKRLEHAAYLIKNSSKNVAEISEEIGYQSISHFIKAFKAKFNVTPKKYLEA